MHTKTKKNKANEIQTVHNPKPWKYKNSVSLHESEILHRIIQKCIKRDISVSVVVFVVRRLKKTVK